MVKSFIKFSSTVKWLLHLVENCREPASELGGQIGRLGRRTYPATRSYLVVAGLRARLLNTQHRLRKVPR